MRSLTALLAAAALAAPAHAAPAPVSARTIEADPVTLGFNAAGEGLASWRGLRGLDADITLPFHALAARAANGAWQAPRLLAPNVAAHDAALDGAHGLALVATRDVVSGKAITRSVLTASVGTLSPLTFGTPRVLARGPRLHVGYDGPRPSLFTPVVAATATGRALVAWQRSVPRVRSGIWVAVMRANGTVGRPRLLGPYGVTPSLALADDGSALLAYRRGSRVLARVRSATGRWGPSEVAARVGRYDEMPAPRLAGADGRFALAVMDVKRSSAGVRWQPSIHLRGAGGTWRAASLGAGAFQPTGATAFVTDSLQTLTARTPDGAFHVAWPEAQGASGHLAAADVSADASGVHVGAAQSFGEAVAVDDIAAGAGNRWAVTWFDLSRPDGTPNLATFGTGAGTTTGLAAERAMLGSRVAYDPSTGRPVVIWSQGDARSGYQIVSGP